MDITEKIFELLGNVDNDFKNLDIDDKIKILDGLDKEWENLPSEKYQNNEKAVLALFLCDEYIMVKDFRKAKKWIEILLMDRLNDPSQVG